MNGKQAKRLRRAALGLAATFSETGKQISEAGQVENPKGIVNRYDSLRGIYRTLKKGVVSGKIGKP